LKLLFWYDAATGASVSKTEKLLEKVLNGAADHNFPFEDLCYLLTKLGATTRQGKGSHVLFNLNGAIINLQSQGGKAKAYQVAQIREILKTK
jgi:hypothetical protein